MLRFILITVIVVAGVGAAAAAYVLQDPNRFKPQLEALVAEQAGVPFEIGGDLSWELWPPVSLAAEGLRGEHQGRSWKVGRLSVDLDARDLLAPPEQWRARTLRLHDVTVRDDAGQLTVSEARFSDLTPRAPVPFAARASYAPAGAAAAVPVSLDGHVTMDPESGALTLERTRIDTGYGSGTCEASAVPAATPVPAPAATSEDVLPVAVLRSFSWNGDCQADWLEWEGRRFENVRAVFSNDAGRARVTVEAPQFFDGEAELDVTVDAARTPLRWVLTPTLTGVDSEALLAWLDKRFTWAAPLAYGGTLTAQGNTPDAMLASLSGETRFDGGQGRIDISRIRGPLIALADMFNEADHIRRWPELWDYQRLVGTWRIESQHHVLDAALDNLSVTGEGNYQPASNEMDMRFELVFGNDPDYPVFDLDPVLYDLPIPIRCRGAVTEPSCGVDPDAAQRIVARALGDDDMRARLERKIDEDVPEQYRDAARSLLEALGNSLGAPRGQ